MFETIVNPDGTISIVPITQSNNLPFQSVTEIANPLILPPVNTAPLPPSISASTMFQDLYYPDSGIMQQAPIDFKRFEGITRETDIDDDTQDTVEETKTGITKLVEFLQKFPTPLNLIRGGLESLSGFNQRLRDTDFGRSKNLMDFLDIRKYGGFQAREDARARAMAQARGITKSLASRPSAMSGEYQQGAGGSGAQSTQTQKDAGPGFSGSGTAAEMGSF